MSNHIRFLCSTCQAVMDAPVKRAGTKIHCLKCGQRLQIPPPEHAKTVLAAGVGGHASGAAPAADDSAWHFVRNGKQLGPVSTEELKQLAAFGQLSTTDVVWKVGMASWVQADKIKGLFSVAAAVSAPPAMPLCPQALSVNVFSESHATVAAHPNRPIAIMPTKSVGVSILLTILFGPLDMLYSTVIGGLLMMFVYAVCFFATLCIFPIGIVLFLVSGPICVIWGAVAVKLYNDRLARYYS